MNLSGIFDVILRRNRKALGESVFSQFIAYFQQRYGATLDYNEESGICTVTRKDGDAMRFEPISFVEMFDIAIAFCQTENDNAPAP